MVLLTRRSIPKSVQEEEVARRRDWRRLRGSATFARALLSIRASRPPDRIDVLASSSSDQAPCASDLSVSCMRLSRLLGTNGGFRLAPRSSHRAVVTVLELGVDPAVGDRPRAGSNYLAAKPGQRPPRASVRNAHPRVCPSAGRDRTSAEPCSGRIRDARSDRMGASRATDWPGYKVTDVCLLSGSRSRRRACGCSWGEQLSQRTGLDISAFMRERHSAAAIVVGTRRMPTRGRFRDWG